MPVFAFPRMAQMAQSPLEVLDFALVINLLPFRQFERLKHFLHFIQSMFELVNDPVYLSDGVRNRGSAMLRLRLLMPRFLSLPALLGVVSPLFRLLPALFNMFSMLLDLLPALLGFFDRGRLGDFCGFRRF
jgi:hypothetical protein